MTITLKMRDVFYDIIMLIAAILIAIQVDEFQRLLLWDFHGMLYAIMLLCVMPFYHSMIALHAVAQEFIDWLDSF